MPQLNGGNGALAADKIGNSAIGGDVIVGIYPGTFIGFAAAFLDRGFFRKHDSCAADRVFSKIDKMPVSGAAVLRFILAHRRNDNAIARKNATQGDGLKQQRNADASIMHFNHPQDRKTTSLRFLNVIVPVESVFYEFSSVIAQ